MLKLYCSTGIIMSTHYRKLNNSWGHRELLKGLIFTEVSVCLVQRPKLKAHTIDIQSDKSSETPFSSPTCGFKAQIALNGKSVSSPESLFNDALCLFSGKFTF